MLAIFASAMFFTDSSYAASTCDGTKTTIIKCSDDRNGIWSLLLIALNVLTAGVGIVAVAGIVYASILWTTAEDKAETVNKAKNILTNTVIGLIAFALMFALLQFLVPGGALGNASTFANVTNPGDPTPQTPDGEPDGPSNPPDGDDGGGGGGGGGDITSINLLKNARDASTTNNGVLKPGVLFRSGHLGRMNSTGAGKLSNILGSDGLIIDLRTASQRAEEPDVNIDGVAKKNIPIDGVHETGPMVTDPTRRAQLAQALKAAANASGPVLVHCWSGKDRTGWMVAMIMYVNGANDGQVMNEYLQSNDDIPGGVDAAWLNDGLQAVRQQYGTVPNYLREIGLSGADLTKLKNKFGA